MDSFGLDMLRGSEVVDGLVVRLKPEPKVADSDDDDVERRRFRARSLASSIFSRAVRVLFACGLMLALSRCWGTVLDAVIESSSLWNLRFDVAIASGMVVYFAM
jgi:hypothetical protein